MPISTKSRFAVNALIDLALRQPAGPVTLASISRRQKISLSYLEQLFSRLRRVGLVESTRGPGGGYTLARSADAISVAEVVEAVDEPVAEAAAQARGAGMARDLCQRLSAVMRQHMAAIKLDSLVAEQLAQGAAVALLPPPPRRTLPAAAAPVRRPQRALPPNSVFAFGRSFAA
jgi:Rrf2 family iron-sulfur cluster assembly transcriptional regulator